MSAKKAIAAGHICLDITPLFPADKKSTPDELLVPGKLLKMNGVDVHTGGSVANTGLAMKLLGADVRLMGKVGSDAFGKMVLELLAQYGCDGGHEMILSDSASTSYSVVLAPPGVDRMFLHDTGANDTFCCGDLDEAALRQSDLFHFGYPPLMRRMYENGGEELIKVFRKVKSLGLASSLDMALPDPDSDAGKADWREILGKLLPYTDFFLPSAEELCFMLDRPRWEEWKKRCPNGDVTEMLSVEYDVRPLADALMDMGARVVVIKCGAPGLYYRTADQQTLSPLCERLGLNADDWVGKEGFQPGFPVRKLCSAAGAGDVSIAAFLTAVLEGKGCSDCVRLAAAAGAVCAETYDTLSGLCPLSELNEKLP